MPVLTRREGSRDPVPWRSGRAYLLDRLEAAKLALSYVEGESPVKHWKAPKPA